MTSSAPVPAAGGAGLVQGEIRRVIVGVDTTAAGIAALRYAVGLAGARRVPLVAVRAWALGLPRHGGRRLRHLVHKHVVLSFSGWEQRDAATVLTQRALQTAVGVVPDDLDVVIRTPAGDPAVALTEIAAEPGDVLVLGHGHGITPREIVHGSVTAYCARHARCPVIVVARNETSFLAGRDAA